MLQAFCCSYLHKQTDYSVLFINVIVMESSAFILIYCFLSVKCRTLLSNLNLSKEQFKRA